MAAAFALSTCGKFLHRRSSTLSVRRPICLSAASQSQASSAIPSKTDQPRVSKTPESVHVALAAAGSSVQSAASQLWHLDVNRLHPGKDYKLDLQDRSRGVLHDAAKVHMFSHMSPTVWEKPTFGTFWRLLDNYVPETGVAEQVTKAERAEEIAFLRAVCATPIAQFLHRWLHANAPSVEVSTTAQFAVLLHHIWFKLYRRNVERDSSAFEHVFCGEIDDGQVKGLHNFVQIYRQEQDGRFDYRGFLPARGTWQDGDVEPMPSHQLLTVRFKWLGRTKPASSMFVGTSPEFELALYTLLFVAGEHDATVQLGPYTARVKVYESRGNIGGAFPTLVSIDEKELDAQYKHDMEEDKRRCEEQGR